MPARLPPESFPAARPMPGNVTEVVAAWAGARWPESNVPGSPGCDVLSQDSPGQLIALRCSCPYLLVSSRFSQVLC